MSAHTPGPWAIRCGAPLFRPGSTNVLSARGDYVCEVGHIDQTHVEADAALIAAAPELLDALCGLIELESMDPEDAEMEADAAYAAARAAIAKATGEPA